MAPGLCEGDQLLFQRTASVALRVTLARTICGSSYRSFAARLADSTLLQWFCRMERMGRLAKIRGKSQLQRYQGMVRESELREVVEGLLESAAEEDSALDLGTQFLDSTCVKLNIHYPTDWVLLRDAVRTLRKTTLRRMTRQLKIVQAHERIIGGRQVSNAEKILSLYEGHAAVYVRGKAGAEVEFGSQLLLPETRSGLIADWELVCGNPEHDTVLMKRRLDRDQARIAIFKNVFLGAPLLAKGYENQARQVAWAALAHNLWLLTELPVKRKTALGHNKRTSKQAVTHRNACTCSF